MTDLHPACPSAFHLISATVIYNDSSLIQKCTCVLTSLEESKEEGKIFCKSWLNDLWACWRKAKLTRNDTWALPCSKQFGQEEVFLLPRAASEEKRFSKRPGKGCPTPPRVQEGVLALWSPLAMAGRFLKTQGCACELNLPARPRPHSLLAP